MLNIHRMANGRGHHHPLPQPAPHNVVGQAVPRRSVLTCSNDALCTSITIWRYSWGLFAFYIEFDLLGERSQERVYGEGGEVKQQVSSASDELRSDPREKPRSTKHHEVSPRLSKRAGLLCSMCNGHWPRSEGCILLGNECS